MPHIENCLDNGSAPSLVQFLMDKTAKQCTNTTSALQSDRSQLTCGTDGAADDERELKEEEEDPEEADDDGLHLDAVQLGVFVPDLKISEFGRLMILDMSERAGSEKTRHSPFLSVGGRARG